MKKLYSLSLFFSLLILKFCVGADDISIETFVDPGIIEIGETALYKIEISGRQTVRNVNVPSVDGLRIQFNKNHSYSIQGVTQSKYIMVYSVKAERVGDYEIPEFKIKILDQLYKVPSVRLKVVEAGNYYSAGSSSGKVSKSGSNFQEMIFKIGIFRNKLYVGEVIPCQLKLWIPRNLSGQITGVSFPKINSDGFSVLPFQEKHKEQIIIHDNLQYFEVSWNTAITALKAGQFNLEFSIDLNVLELTQDSVLNILGFLQNPNFNQRSIQISTQPSFIYVMEVIGKEKPQGYSGAIGEFEILSNVDTQTVNVGDPLTLTLTIQGVGNFDRITAPDLNFGKTWKIYPPKISFQSKDNIGFQGTKKFEYVVIPLKEGEQIIPAIDFSFLNSQLDQFQELKTQPIKMNVLKDEDVVAEKLNSPSNLISEKMISSNENLSDSAIDMRTEIDYSSVIIVNFYSMYPKFFWVFQILMGVFLVGFYKYFKHKKYLKNHPEIQLKKNLYNDIQRLFGNIENSIRNRESQKIFKYIFEYMQMFMHYKKEEYSRTWSFHEIKKYFQDNKIVNEDDEKVLKLIFDKFEFIEYGSKNLDINLSERQNNQLKEFLNKIHKEVKK